MGFAIVANGGATGFGSVSYALPSGTKDGDEVFLAILDNNSNTAITPPSGFTAVGGMTQQQFVNSGASRCGVFSKTWHTGDPTTITFTTGSGAGNTNSLCWVVRSKNSRSVVSALQVGNTVPTQTNFPVKKCVPAATGDLRMVVIFYGTVSGGGNERANPPSSVTPSANNPTGLPMQSYLLSSGGSGFNCEVFVGYWDDPTGFDANDAVWTLGGTLNFNSYYSYSFVLSDGDDVSPASGLEAELFEANIDQNAYAMDQSGTDSDSANAGWWGGGVNETADHD